ncbi:hypothetical protein BDA99DRAFT_563030 [Phascolomyces articulosus]|uniref:Uncharacterized protein n=1 Tax=Phascolomyces articulosus TaxID=60185 RepID=A0AAD5JT91_9FUNG|nr:hypothetical protein BDA99DRAFT_563030 [Phascolomyces articulosus]
MHYPYYDASDRASLLAELKKEVEEQSLPTPFDLCKDDWIANTMLRLRWKNVIDAQNKRERDGIEDMEQ